MATSFAPLVGSEPPLILGVVLYPMMTALDFVGPLATLSMCCTTHMLSKTLDPVPTESNFSVVPTTTFADCPEHLDILLIPGGFGSNAAMEDHELLDFLRSRGANASYVTSVCSGSTVLGAAGLLNGYKAATHWAYYPVLESMNIATGRERVVIDRNRMSGGGVTAGIDFGLTLLAELRGDDVAKRMQLMLEYDPHPPFTSGHPRTAEPRITEDLLTWIKPFTDEAIAIGKASLEGRTTTV
jgi:cyclohexyl-isocyanide hydratase